MSTTKLKHFENANAVHEYIVYEFLATLRDDLHKMQTSEYHHYTNDDRTDMKNKIHDVALILREKT